MKTMPTYHPTNRNWRLHYQATYQGLPVLYENPEDGPLVVNHLERTLNVINRARHRQSRTFAIRFDLYLPNEEQIDAIERDSHILKTFWRYLDREINASRLTHPANMAYIWARERGPVSGKTHFHVLLLLNGNAICSLGNPGPSHDGTFSDATLAHRIFRSWLWTLGYPAIVDYRHLVHFQKDLNTRALMPLLLHRDEEEPWQFLFYLASYLTKSKTKPVGEGLRTFDTSRDYAGQTP